MLPPLPSRLLPSRCSDSDSSLVHQSYRCALVAQAVYTFDDLAHFGLPSATDRQLHKLFGTHYLPLFDLSGGFHAKVYHDTHAGDDTFILGFGGTNPVNPSDWISNFQQFFGKPADQYEQGIALADRLDDRWASKRKLIVTGHSLGGGIATVAAIARKLDAYVFNPPCIHKNTLARFDSGHIARADDLVHRFVVAGDILDVLNKVIGLNHHRIGHKTQLYGSFKIPISSFISVSALFKRMIPVAGPVLAVGGPIVEKMLALHGMDEVLHGLRQYFRG